MKLDRANIVLAPRTTLGCLDMAAMFCGRNLKILLALWAVVTIPCFALTYAAAAWFDFGLLAPMLIAFFASAVLGTLLVRAAGDRVFGQPISTRRTIVRGLREHPILLIRQIAKRIVTLMGLLICLFPGVLFAVRTGFVCEQAMLPPAARLPGESSATDAQIEAEYGELLLRAGLIAAFCGLLWMVVFVTVDIALGRLFGFPVLIGRLAGLVDSYYAEQLLAELLWYDIRVHWLAVATTLAVYLIGRLAWFFCYIDLQVRMDCWDLQVQFLMEAQRLESAASGDPRENAA